MSYEPPKPIKIKECRRCGRQNYVGDHNITLRPDDEIEFIPLIYTCQECKEQRHDPKRPM